MTYPRLYAVVSHKLHERVTEQAHIDGVSVSKLTAALIREGLDARAREAERVRREFELRPSWPTGPYSATSGDWYT